MESIKELQKSISSLLAKEVIDIEKYKEYWKPGIDYPKDTQWKKGPRGKYFYEVDSMGATEPSGDFEVPAVPEVQYPVLEGTAEFKRFVRDVVDDFQVNRVGYQANLQKLVPGIEIQSIELTGSYSPTGTPTEASDIDVLVKYAGDLTDEEVVDELSGRVVGVGGAFDVIAQVVPEVDSMGATEPSVDFEVTAVDKLKHSIKSFERAASEIINSLPKDHTENIKIHLVGSKDLDAGESLDFVTYAQYEPFLGVISISRDVNHITDKEFSIMYNDDNTEKEMPGVSKPWKSVFLHELGHKIHDTSRKSVKDAWLLFLKQEASDRDIDSDYDKKGVTKYARTHHKERFAESYLYYIQNPLELKKKDPNVYKFMNEHIFKGEEFPEPLIKQKNEQENGLALGSIWEIPGGMEKLRSIMNSNNEKVTDTITKFLKKADGLSGYPGMKTQRRGSMKGASGYVPVQVLVHRKDGTIVPSIRWKSFGNEQLIRIKSNRNLSAVRNVSETPAFTRFSSIKQTMFFLADKLDIENIYNNKFLPTIEYEFLGDGIYLYNKIETAQERAKELKREILPVKADVSKALSTRLDDIRTKNIDNIKNQGYTAVVLMKDTIYEFDLFCFDSRDIVVIGDDDLTEDVKKAIEDHELQDAESIVTKEYLDTLKGIPYDNSNSEIEKARPQPAPLNEDGTVDYDGVKTGDSIWITVTDESSPLHGRPIIITKKPDGLFALTGGSGSSSFRHATMAGKPKKTKADVEYENKQKERQEKRKELDIERKKLRDEGKEKIKETLSKFEKAIHIEKEDKLKIDKHREELKNYALNYGLDNSQAQSWATAIINNNKRANKHINGKRKNDVVEAILNSQKDEFQAKKLNSSDEYREEIKLPIGAMEGLTPEEIKEKINEIYDEKLSEKLNPNPEDKNINYELEKEGIEISPVKKDPNALKIEIGTEIKPFDITDEKELKNAIDTFKEYHSINKQVNKLTKQIGRKINIKETTPAMIEQLRMKIRGVLGEDISDEEMAKVMKGYDSHKHYNNNSLAFYNAIHSDFWNDEKALREQLVPLDSSFGGYVNTGAASAIAAITGKLEQRFDSLKLIDKTNIDATCMAIAFTLSPNSNSKNKLSESEYNSLIENIEKYNSTNQEETEKRALDRNAKLKKNYETIQKAKKDNLLATRISGGDGEENQIKTEYAVGEIENLIEQKKNMGIALGSLQASATLLNALIVAKNSKDEEVSLNFGADKAGAELKQLELKLGSKTKLENIDGEYVLRTNASDIVRYAKTLNSVSEIEDRNNLIKNNSEGTTLGEDGNRIVNDYHIPKWKDTYVNQDEYEEKYNVLINKGVGETEAENRAREESTHEYKSRMEQRNDIEFLKNNKGSGLITRVTGAGKTNTALGFFANQISQNENYSGVIVVPKGRGNQWTKEAKMFSELDIVQIPDSIKKEDREKELLNFNKEGRGKVMVISHRNAAASADILEALATSGKVQGLVLDEPQDIASKSISGNMSASVRKLTRLNVENRIALTATPARNNLIEAFDLVNWVSHKDSGLGSRESFKRLFSGYGSGTNAQDTALAQQIYKKLSPYMSGDRLTNPNFKVSKNDHIVKKTDKQNKNMAKIEREAKVFVKDQKDKHIAEIQRDEKKLESYKKKYGEKWKVRAATESKRDSEKKLIEQHDDNLSGIGYTMTWEDNPKINGMVKNIQGGNPDDKHVIYVDNNSQIKAVKEALIGTKFFKANQIKNIASSVVPVTGPQMAKLASDFRKDKNIKVIFIDKNSASGYNLQEANNLHVLGTPSDAATFLQAQGRLARMPREGDISVHTYKYSDNSFEDQKWAAIDQQMAILRATAPGLFVGEDDENE